MLVILGQCLSNHKGLLKLKFSVQGFMLQITFRFFSSIKQQGDVMFADLHSD